MASEQSHEIVGIKTTKIITGIKTTKMAKHQNDMFVLCKTLIQSYLAILDDILFFSVPTFPIWIKFPILLGNIVAHIF